MAHVILSSTVFTFLTNLSEECKSPWPSEIQVKGQWKNQYWREIRHNNLTWKRWTNCWRIS